MSWFLAEIAQKSQSVCPALKEHPKTEIMSLLTLTPMSFQTITSFYQIRELECYTVAQCGLIRFRMLVAVVHN